MYNFFLCWVIFSNCECSWGLKFIPNMRQISREVDLWKSPKMFFKNVIFWLKKSNFFNLHTLSSRAAKKYGGPHAACGPHFNHVCYKLSCVFLNSRRHFNVITLRLRINVNTILIENYFIFWKKAKNRNGNIHNS